MKPAAFTFRRISFGRLGLHGRIIHRPGQPEQGILSAIVNVGSISGERVTSMIGLASSDSPSGKCPKIVRAGRDGSRLPVSDRLAALWGRSGPTF